MYTLSLTIPNHNHISNPNPNLKGNSNPKPRSLFQTSWWRTFVIAPTSRYSDECGIEMCWDESDIADVTSGPGAHVIPYLRHWEQDIHVQDFATEVTTYTCPFHVLCSPFFHCVLWTSLPFLRLISYYLNWAKRSGSDRTRLPKCIFVHFWDLKIRQTDITIVWYLKKTAETISAGRFVFCSIWSIYSWKCVKIAVCVQRLWAVGDGRGGAGTWHWPRHHYREGGCHEILRWNDPWKLVSWNQSIGDEWRGTACQRAGR